MSDDFTYEILLPSGSLDRPGIDTILAAGAAHGFVPATSPDGQVKIYRALEGSVDVPADAVAGVLAELGGGVAIVHDAFETSAFLTLGGGSPDLVRVSFEAWVGDDPSGFETFVALRGFVEAVVTNLAAIAAAGYWDIQADLEEDHWDLVEALAARRAPSVVPWTLLAPADTPMAQLVRRQAGVLGLVALEGDAVSFSLSEAPWVIAHPDLRHASQRWRDRAADA